MTLHNVVSIFSQEEEGYYLKFRKFRDRFFLPVLEPLTRLGVKPEHLSYFQVFLALCFAFFSSQNAYAGVAIMFLGLLVDAVDGCLARHQKNESAAGALLDIAADHFFFFAAGLSFIYFKTVDGFWGSFYLLNYLLMIAIIMAMRKAELQVFPVFRSKYYFYAFWIFYVVTGANYLGIFLVFFAVYMSITNLMLFHKYRCSLP